MASSNLSPSYNKMRSQVRRWLSTTDAGKFTVQKFQKMDGLSTIGKVLTDDSWTRFEDVYTEHKDNLMIASSCAEARATFDLARQSNTQMAPPMSQYSKFLRFFAPPIWYVLRKQIDTGDPNYWNSPMNTFREALANPEWATVPLYYIRGALNEVMPKGKAQVQRVVSE